VKDLPHLRARVGRSFTRDVARGVTSGVAQDDMTGTRPTVTCVFLSDR
jgi:hypothetical protein